MISAASHEKETHAFPLRGGRGRCNACAAERAQRLVVMISAASHEKETHAFPLHGRFRVDRRRDRTYDLLDAW